jgi:phage baseplate assembly protein W
MPIPQVVRVYPLDLQKNVAIGVSLPFNGPGVFNSTYSTKDQVKSNVINLLLTNRGERIMNPNFGADIKDVLFEGMTETITPLIQDRITTAFSSYIPQARIDNIGVVFSEDTNTVNVTVNYTLNISGESDQVNIEFQ